MSKPISHVFRLAPLCLALFAATATWAQQAGAPAYERKAAAVHRAEAGRALGQAAGNNHGQVVASVLRVRGRDDASLAALRDAGAAAGRNGATHRRFEQTVEGLAVHGAYAKAAFNRSGELVHLIDHLATVPAQALAPSAIDAQQALRSAMARLHPGVAADLRAAATRGNTTEFAGGAFFHSAPSATAVAVPMADGSMARGWLVETWTARTNQLHHSLISGDGRVLRVESRTSTDSYNVFVEDPVKTAQATVAGPGTGNAESPLGWLGSGAQSTINIAGNNVNAYLDAKQNNRPDRGGSAVGDGNFAATANLTQSPSAGANPAVAVQNLFYLNNVVHDILYRHGFNEAAGNFQADNGAQGGKDGDPVQAEAQDGGGLDNANFATPADGRKPRMQMYLWTGAGATHEVVVGATSYGAMGAAWGPALTTAGLAAGIVLVNDGVIGQGNPAGSVNDGCEALPAAAAAAVAGKIALVDRGFCAFTLKALNAQAAGAAGIIVANNGAGAIFTMGGTERVRIPGVMVSQTDGAALRTGAALATMRIKAVQPNQIDASLDSDVVFHEYGHGLTWRMIGGMSGPMAGAIGEGMSDGLAMLINGDDRIGEYSASDPLGIRRAPYANYPLHYGQFTGAEVHNDGEIYAAIVWKMMELFPGRIEQLFTYVVDGMNFTPATPRFEDMREGILTAVGANATDACLVRQAFAKFGAGAGADGSVIPPTPSFATGAAGCDPLP